MMMMIAMTAMILMILEVLYLCFCSTIILLIVLLLIRRIRSRVYCFSFHLSRGPLSVAYRSTGSAGQMFYGRFIQNVNCLIIELSAIIIETGNEVNRAKTRALLMIEQSLSNWSATPTIVGLVAWGQLGGFYDNCSHFDFVSTIHMIRSLSLPLSVCHSPWHPRGYRSLKFADLFQIIYVIRNKFFTIRSFIAVAYLVIDLNAKRTFQLAQFKFRFRIVCTSHL